jgi:Cu2+-exporting ATPase
MPFFRSAFAALRHARTNMDVPISVGVILVTSLSLAENFAGARHTYYDSAITLLFFLLIGRVLDHRARGQARATAEQLLTLRGTDVAVLEADGSTERRAQQAVQPGDRILVASGERIGVDGVVERGASSLDASLVTGESLPVAAAPGTAVFAGTVNLGEPLTVRATATGGATLLAECVRLIEAAEARRSRFVVLADRVARRYAPAVHLTALLTFLGWYVGAGAPLEQSLLTACAVLIITCPCALALAVPAVQVIATSRLFRAGVLLKSATALERLAEIDTVVFDKTGTLTLGRPQVQAVEPLDRSRAELLTLAAAAEAASEHPYGRAVVRLAEAEGLALPAAEEFQAEAGSGVRAMVEGRLVEVGRPGEAEPPADWAQRAWTPLAVRIDGRLAGLLALSDQPRPEAAAAIARLKRDGLSVAMLTGDDSRAAAAVAAAVGIAEFQARRTPQAKLEALSAWRAGGAVVAMVGDGLNDAPALAAADVGIAMGGGAEVALETGDIALSRDDLRAVAEALALSRAVMRTIRGNLWWAFGYNLLMAPLAAGLWPRLSIAPMWAAAAMALSSVSVVGNSLRLRAWRAG